MPLINFDYKLVIVGGGPAWLDAVLFASHFKLMVFLFKK